MEITPKEVRQRQTAGEKLALIDVREPAEHVIANIADAELIPMSYIPVRLQEIEKKADSSQLIVFCHHGVRSLQVVHWLREQGVSNCVSMAGGIDRWSLEIDSTVPRY